MPSLGQPFKREGVPRSQEALAALGVEKAKKGLERERKGAKGLDEIGLNEAEVSAAREVEGIWDRERMIEWARTIGDDEKYNETWVDEMCAFLPDGSIQYQKDLLTLRRSKITELPPNLRVKKLNISFCREIHQLPDNLGIEVLNLVGTKIRQLPLNLGILDRVVMRSSQMELRQNVEKRGVTSETLF